ncbi:MAG: dihydrolipoyl dehydrogenase [Nitrospirota bacterium]
MGKDDLKKKRLVIIGGGPGGYVAAIRGAQSGFSVIVIEERKLGGTCLHRGCIPTKSIISSVELIDKIKKGKDFGLKIPDEIGFDLQKIIERKDKIVGSLTKGIKGLFKSYGIEVVEGKASLLDVNRVKAVLNSGEERTIPADNIIIAAGSRPSIIPNIVPDGNNIITSDEAVNLTDLPEKMLIIGGGVIGCEFAFIFNILGVDITIVELLPDILSTEDEDIQSIMKRELKKRKIRLFTEVKVEKIEKKEENIITYLSNGEAITVDKVLVSIGRAFNVEGLGLEKIGVAQGKNGVILVDERMETNIKGIYAIGDVVGNILLAHVASAEGKVAVENIAGNDTTMDYSIIPAGIFTFPEIGSVGIREREAKEKGIAINVGRFQFRGLGKSQAMGEITGLVKIISDASSNRILGAHIVGCHATDLIHEIALAIQIGAKGKDIANMIHSHPTLSEGIMEAAEDIYGLSIHLPKK